MKYLLGGNGNMLNIRDGLIVDWQDICRLNREVLGYDMKDSEMRDQLKRILSSGDNKIFVAEEGGEVLAYIHIQAYDTTYLPSLLNVLGIAVAKKAQGQKIGTQLLACAEEWGRDSGCKGVRLNSDSKRKHAHEFYEKNGYEMVKTQKNFLKLFEKSDEDDKV